MRRFFRKLLRRLNGSIRANYDPFRSEGGRGRHVQTFAQKKNQGDRAMARADAKRQIRQVKYKIQKLLSEKSHANET